MIYEVSHRTVYGYSQPVSISHHLLHLVPRARRRQTTRETALEVTPAPSVRTSGIDYFGNPTTFLTVQQSHRELVLHALSFVEVRAPVLPAPAATAPWEELVARLATDRSPAALEAHQFRFASPYVPLDGTVEAYGRVSFTPGRPALEAARELTGRIHADFAYDPAATTVATPLAEAFRLRRGVCQDFAHIQLACLRALGLPARYVSGYLLTHPTEGLTRLVGADASHAWISLWLPDEGWIDLDPTNDVIPTDEHITLAWGRDYGDVSPILGVMLGGGRHEVRVAVDVTAIGRA